MICINLSSILDLEGEVRRLLAANHADSSGVSPPLQLGGKRQQGDVARPLDGLAQPALMTRAGAGQAPRQEFAALLHERLEHLDLLVVDKVHAVHAEPADLLLAKVLPLAATRASRTSRPASFPAGSRGASFAAGAGGGGVPARRRGAPRG